MACYYRGTVLNLFLPKLKPENLIMKKFKFILFLLASFLLSQSAVQAGNFDISFKIKGLKEGDECLLAYYVGTKQYILDTLISDNKGLVRFQPEEDPETGLFLLVLPGQKFFEFILVEESFTLESTVDDLINSMKIIGSKENEAYFEYLRTIDPLQKEGTKLGKTLGETEDEKEKEKLKERLGEIEKQAKQIKTDFVAKHPGLFVSKTFQATMDPVIPEFKDENGETDYKKRLAWFRAEYWKNLDFSEESLIRTPVLETKIKDFMKKYTVQDPDSLIASAKIIMDHAEAKGSKEMVRVCTIILTNMYAGAKQMCMDKVYVFMSGEYYVKRNAWWVDSTQMVKIKDRYYKMMYNTCGSKAPNLVMPDVDGKMRQLYEVESPYTVLYFWAYDCGHCKKVTPKVKKFWEDYKDHGVKVFSVSTKKEMEPWKKAIEEKGIEDWINVSDPDNLTRFRVFYDIYSTPVIYLLDSEKRIIAKRLDVKSLRLFLNHELDLDIPVPEGDADPELKK